MSHEPNRIAHPGRLRTLGAVAIAVAFTGVAAPAGAAPAAVTASCANGYVGLTFDDGPTGSTTTLLNALRANGLRVTMFNIGQKVQQNPGLAQSQQAAGMWVGNHSWTHPHLTQLGSAQIQSEISQTQNAIRSATGSTPRLFRPPYGETNATVRGVEAQFGLTEVLWDVDSQDWNGASTAQIVQAAGRLTNGQVILMHDGIQNTINAIPQIASGLAGRGLCAGMISPATGRAVAPDGGQPPGGGGTCTATYAETQRWINGFNGQVTVRAGGTAITSWTATVTMRSGQRITATWNGTPSWDASGNVMTMRPNGNGNLPAGGSTSFGFTVSVSNGNFSAPAVTCSAT